MLGAELSAIESAAASPGVLVIPPAMVPSRSRMFILNTQYPNTRATIIGTRVMAIPTPNSVQPLSWNVATRLLPADFTQEEQQAELAQELVGRSGHTPDNRAGLSDGA